MWCRIGLSQCITDIDKESIKFIGYVDPVINNSAVGFKFCTRHLVFAFINYKFYYLPWLFDARFMFEQKVMVIFPFCYFDSIYSYISYSGTL